MCDALARAGSHNNCEQFSRKKEEKTTTCLFLVKLKLLHEKICFLKCSQPASQCQIPMYVASEGRLNPSFERHQLLILLLMWIFSHRNINHIKTKILVPVPYLCPNFKIACLIISKAEMETVIQITVVRVEPGSEYGCWGAAAYHQCEMPALVRSLKPSNVELGWYLDGRLFQVLSEDC